MNSQKQISKTDIAKAIQEFYEYCGYEINDKQVIELSKLILSSYEKLTKEQLYEFIYMMKLGEFGMIYKSPISIMAAFNEYKKKKIAVIPVFDPGPDR